MNTEEINQLIDDLVDAFQNIEHFVRCDVPKNERQKFYSPDCLGAISAFLNIGNGYEPAYYKGPYAEDLLDYAYSDDEE